MLTQLLEKAKQNNLLFSLWLILSLIFTLFSKLLMQSIFPYPIILTFIHMLISSILSNIVVIYKKKKDPTWGVDHELNRSEKIKILLFSVIVAINIWISNASLYAVSISLHQILRTSIPLFTMGIGVIFFKHQYKLSQLPQVVMVIIGVAITVNVTPSLKFNEVIIVLLGCIISSLKGIITQKLQVDNIKILPIIMLQYVSPVATMTLALFTLIFGELYGFMLQYKYDLFGTIVMFGSLMLAGVMAFLINILSFSNAAVISPLTMNIAGSVKQILTCLIGCIIFKNPITCKLIIGITLTSIGATWYSMSKCSSIDSKNIEYTKEPHLCDEKDNIEMSSDFKSGSVDLNRCIAMDLSSEANSLIEDDRPKVILEKQKKNFNNLTNIVTEEEIDMDFMFDATYQLGIDNIFKRENEKENVSLGYQWINYNTNTQS
ncbi:hypothetical protein ACR3K2_09090 [Cryptosporidium serpentis]